MQILNETVLENNNIIDEIDFELRKNPEIKVFKSYKGFPVLKNGLYNDKFVIEYLLITEKRLYIINIDNNDYDDNNVILNYQDNVYDIIDRTLRKSPNMIEKRKLICDISTITYAKNMENSSQDNCNIFNSIEKIISFIIDLEKDDNGLSESQLKRINAAIQTAYGTIKRDHRTVYPNTKSEEIDKINEFIENFDDYQLTAITCECNGIQRIRGLAGTGKTIIIARKAAQIHLEHPDWKIVITYSTRSQHDQLINLIDSYYERITDGMKVDYDKVKVMHSWGSAYANGLYYEICLNNEIDALNLNQARSLFNTNKDVFSKLCQSVLDLKKDLKKEYDCIMIDEAQDFKSPFFKLCLKVVKFDRIIYAYDEMQNLGGETMETPQKLFGKKTITDTPLRVCYRNHKEVIVSAHALGMGVYRDELPMQMPSTLDVWDSIGYNCIGKLDYGKNVTLYRNETTSPNILEISNAITIKKFKTDIEQIKFILNEISKNINEDHLLYKDIMIIDLDAYNAEVYYSLFFNNIPSIPIHYAGRDNPDEYFKDDSIVYSSIYRAKGNETFMVYIINADKVINTMEPMKMRNAIFTSITRSKGWVKLLGVGDYMDELIDEFNKVEENDYQLVFNPYPNENDLKKINTYAKELVDTEPSLSKAKKTIDTLVKDNKLDPLKIAQDLFNVKNKDELLKLLNGENNEEE